MAVKRGEVYVLNGLHQTALTQLEIPISGLAIHLHHWLQLGCCLLLAAVVIGYI
jgi:hypothetical protein